VKPVHVIVWEFEARAGKEAEFERAYGSSGKWATLFAKSPDYHGTNLLKSITTRTYLTIDRWTSAAAFADFKRQWHAEYQALDQQMESLTQSEKSIGQYESA
jgi:heme-degrading monooxygenase HmoA